MGTRLRSLAIRVIVATAVAWVLATVPLPQIAPQTLVAFIQVPIVIFALICYIGKVLFDTLFFDHYKS